MLDQETFFVWGRVFDKSDRYPGIPIVIAAYSSRFKENERVGVMHSAGVGTHYGLNLPEGEYRFLVYADVNNDQKFQPTEIIGRQEVAIDAAAFPHKVVKNMDIYVADIEHIEWAESIEFPVNIEPYKSIYYPSGTVRELSDGIFDKNISTMGMYDPAAFLEHAPTMFYALEEDVGHKIPVIFVHGIGGSPRAFASIIEAMDKNRYQPWFFYYPSGGDLEQLASLFYNIFLSGAVIPREDMPLIVVAHSMGGLIVREALNKYQGSPTENKVKLFLSIATPFGGHPAAASGEKNGLIVLPSWRDLNPSSRFLQELYEKPLPEYITHQLFYAYNDDRVLRFGESSDGVVPLSSQLHPPAQMQSSAQFGFNDGHVTILDSHQMISTLTSHLSNVDNIFPESHLRLLVDGGFDIKLPNDYSPASQHLIGYAGKYIVQLAAGAIQPISPEQERFIRAVRGDKAANSKLERELIRFMSEYPELVDGATAH